LRSWKSEDSLIASRQAKIRRRPSPLINTWLSERVVPDKLKHKGKDLDRLEASRGQSIRCNPCLESILALMAVYDSRLGSLSDRVGDYRVIYSVTQSQIVTIIRSAIARMRSGISDTLYVGMGNLDLMRSSQLLPTPALPSPPHALSSPPARSSYRGKRSWQACANG
jgi:hypothetical protein